MSKRPRIVLLIAALPVTLRGGIRSAVRQLWSSCSALAVQRCRRDSLGRSAIALTNADSSRAASESSLMAIRLPCMDVCRAVPALTGD